MKKKDNDISPCTAAVSIPTQMSMSTQEPGLKRIGDMLQLKRKIGRPLKKKTLIRMAKLMTILQKEDANYNNKQDGWVEEQATTVQREVTSHKHKKVIKETQKNESDLRRSSRTTKPVELTDHTEHMLPPSGHIEPFPREEDSTCTLSTASPTRMCSAEAAPQIDVPNLSKGKIKGKQRSPKKSSQIKKEKITYKDPDPPNIPTKTLPEIKPTDNGVEKTTKAKRRKIVETVKLIRKDSKANKKSKQGALEPMFTSVPQEDIYADHDNGISTQTVITPLNSVHQKPLKRTKKKKGKKAMDIPLLITTEQFGVCCSLPESPVTQSPVECDADNPRKAKKQCNIKSPQQSDSHPSEKKSNMKCVTSTKAKKSRKRKVPETNGVDSSTADIILGEMPVCSSQSVHGSKLKNKNSCHSNKTQTEAVSSLTRDSLPIKVEPQTRKGSRNKLNNADVTSNPETEKKTEKKSQQKSRVKKKRITKTLNLSTALPRPTAANENILLPVLNPTIAAKPKHPMPSLPTSPVSLPVSESLATPSEKGQVAEPVSAHSLKRKQPQKVMRSKKREVRTSKPKLHNGCNVSNDEDLVKCTEMDGILNKMENGPKMKKRVMKASMGKTEDLNMQSTGPESLVHSTVTEDKIAPVAVKVKHKKSSLPPSSATPPLPSSAAPTDEGQLAQSASPAGVKRQPQQRGKLSKRKSRPPRKNRKQLNNRNNLSKEIEPLESVKVPSDKVLVAQVVKDAFAVASTAEQENTLAGLNHYTSPSGRNTKDISILSDSTIKSVAQLDNTLWESTDAPNINQSSSQSETITSNNMDVLCDGTVQKVRQQSCGAQGETGVSETVHENKEAVNRLSTAVSTLLRSNVKLRKPITCRFCGCTFRRISAYSVHECIHTGKKPYRCLKCGKRFTQFSKLRLHANIHRRPGPIQCPCCPLGFPNKAELIVHFKTHMKRTKKVSLMRRGRDIQAQKPANDTLPPLPLKTSAARHSSFNDTLEINTSPSNGLSKPYICSICGMKFDKSSSYYIHGRTHRHAQPYACSVCGEGFNQLRNLKAHSRTHSGEMPSSAARYDDTSCGLSSPHSHPTSKVRSETIDEADGSTVDSGGFLVKQGVDGQINTPMFFKCQICKQLHRHWCQYVLHLQTHTKVYLCLCEVCRQQYNQVSKTTIHCKVCCKKSGEERACNASLSEVLQGPPSSQIRTLEHPPEIFPGDHQERSSLASSSEIICRSEHQKKQPARKLSGLLANASRRRFACAQCGKSFNQWNKLWLHHKTHRQKARCFPCTQCKLKFYYFGSYRDHMQEHAAHSPFVCPLCPKDFIASEDLSNHLREHHNPCKCLKCDTCEKCFTSFQSLERHGRLHKGANSNHCLLCDVSFRSTSALQDHLKNHKSLLRNPLPIGPVEPFLYPYHCRKCKARFTSTDLLQAHQVCHLNASGKPVSSSPQTVASSHPSKTPSNGIPKALPVFPKQKKTCRVSKRNNLFRYPHPDHLYVVPVLSSEPPVVISDREEPQVIVTTPLTPSSPIDNPSDIVCNGHANDITEVTPSQSPQPTPKSTTVLLNDVNAKLCRQATTPLKHASSGGPLGRDLVQNVPPHGQAVSIDEDADDEYEDDDFVEVAAAAETPGEPECDEFSCVVCQATFTVVSDLHDHYVHHARGVI